MGPGKHCGEDQKTPCGRMKNRRFWKILLLGRTEDWQQIHNKPIKRMQPTTAFAIRQPYVYYVVQME